MLNSTINRPLRSFITIVSACVVPVSKCYSMRRSFYCQVSEFSTEIDVAGLTHDPGGIFVIFIDVLDGELDQMANISTYTGARSITSPLSPTPSPGLSPSITRTLVFKCIGAAEMINSRRH